MVLMFFFRISVFRSNLNFKMIMYKKLNINFRRTIFFFVFHGVCQRGREKVEAVLCWIQNTFVAIVEVNFVDGEICVERGTWSFCSPSQFKKIKHWMQWYYWNEVNHRIIYDLEYHSGGPSTMLWSKTFTLLFIHDKFWYGQVIHSKLYQTDAEGPVWEGCPHRKAPP